MLQILISCCDIQPAEERQEVADDGERHDENTDLHGIVGPIGHVGLGWYRHIGNGRKHGGKDTDACCPPRNAIATLEEIFRSRLALHEVVAQQEHGDEVDYEHQVVEPSELSRIRDGETGGIGRANARFQFAIDNIIGISRIAFHHSCARTGQPLVGIDIRPSTSDGVVYQQ